MKSWGSRAWRGLLAAILIFCVTACSKSSIIESAAVPTPVELVTITETPTAFNLLTGTPSLTERIENTLTPTPDATVEPEPWKSELRFEPWELVTSVAWSPDGKFIATGAGDSIYLFETAGFTRVGQYRLPTGAFTHALALSSNGRWLAAGSQDGMLRVWEVKEWVDNLPETDTFIGEPAWEVEAHQKGVNSVVFSPNGEYLASGGNDAMVRIWNLVAGEQVNQVIGGTYVIPSIAFSPNGESLAVVNGDTIRLREPSSGRIQGSFLAPAPLYSVDLDPSGEQIVASDTENRILIWEISQAYKSGNEIYPEPDVLSRHSGRAGSTRALVWSVCYSPDGRWLASAGGDGNLWLWDSTTGEAIELILSQGYPLTSLAFSPDGKWLAAGSLGARLYILPFSR